jgi:hypothetical protein
MEPRFVMRILLFVMLLTAAAAVVPLGSPAALAPADVDYVIITTPGLANAFEPLAAFKNQLGLPTRVVTLDWLAGQVTPGADQPATIRRFLQEAHVAWGTRYVLLGGTVDLVPTRWVTSTFYPTGGSTLIPADLYYAALDGDWDGDGDGVYCEPRVGTTDPGDAADLVPEIALGRVPVVTAEQVALFVRKNLDFQIQNGAPTVARALLEGEVVFPFRYGQYENYVILDGAIHSEIVRTLLEGAAPAWQTERFYEYRPDWPQTQVPTGPAVLAAMNTGSFRLVNIFYFTMYERVLRFGQDAVPYSALSQLTNPLPFFLAFTAMDAAAPDSTTPLQAALLAPAGGCAGGIGFTRPAFPNYTPTYLETFYSHALSSPTATVGQAFAATFADLIAHTDVNYVERWSHLTFTLLADPTASLQPIDMTVANEGDSADDDGADDALPALRTALTAAPNPFNPQVEIRAELPAPDTGRLCVCDLRGGVVRELFAGALPAGESRWLWDGRDATGRAAASGVYLLRLETGRRIVQRSVTLAR